MEGMTMMQQGVAASNRSNRSNRSQRQAADPPLFDGGIELDWDRTVSIDWSNASCLCPVGDRIDRSIDRSLRVCMCGRKVRREEARSRRLD
jgi:hypothetical protein